MSKLYEPNSENSIQITYKLKLEQVDGLMKKCDDRICQELEKGFDIKLFSKLYQHKSQTRTLGIEFLDFNSLESMFDITMRKIDDILYDEFRIILCDAGKGTLIEPTGGVLVELEDTGTWRISQVKPK